MAEAQTCGVTASAVRPAPEPHVITMREPFEMRPAAHEAIGALYLGRSVVMNAVRGRERVFVFRAKPTPTGAFLTMPNTALSGPRASIEVAVEIGFANFERMFSPLAKLSRR